MGPYFNTTMSASGFILTFVPTLKSRIKKAVPEKKPINNPKSKCLLSKRRRREEIFNDWNLFIFNFLAIISSGL